MRGRLTVICIASSTSDTQTTNPSGNDEEHSETLIEGVPKHYNSRPGHIPSMSATHKGGTFSESHSFIFSTVSGTGNVPSQ